MLRFASCASAVGAVALVVVVALAGCPARKEVIETVGGAPRAQVDEAHDRVHKAEAKIQQQTDEAAAAHE